jgi:hypothetical protein
MFLSLPINLLVLLSSWPLIRAEETVEDAGQIDSPVSYREELTDLDYFNLARIARVLVDQSPHAVGVIGTNYPSDHPSLASYGYLINQVVAF